MITTIYKRIREISEKKEVSIYRIEKDLGFAPSSICKWKKSIPSAEKLKKVANYLGVSMDELLETSNSDEEKKGA